jgi:hypothetical protein
MKTIRVVPSLNYVNPKNGVKASIYGAYPGDGWEMVKSGYTWQTCENGSVKIGLGRIPAKTKEEATEVANKWASIVGGKVLA